LLLPFSEAVTVAVPADTATTATLPLALPANSLAESNKLQPGQAYTSAAAGTFGTITSTVGRTVGLGTSRQVQFAFRLNF
jgi:hypothetical protein